MGQCSKQILISEVNCKYEVLYTRDWSNEVGNLKQETLSLLQAAGGLQVYEMWTLKKIYSIRRFINNITTSGDYFLVENIAVIWITKTVSRLKVWTLLRRRMSMSILQLD
jgi:hypothetical protein